MVELHGGFVLPNRLVETDCQGHQMSVLLLKPVIVDVVADDNRRHVHGQAEKYVKHKSTPPSVLD